MEFVLLGFDQSSSVRRFRFESVGADHRRTPVVVIADLTLAREYDIQVQNLPLLCRELLMRSEPGSLAAGLVTLTAADMAATRLAATAQNEEKKPRRARPVMSNNAEKTWRAPLTFASA
jgi:hypothetical protein